MSILTLLQKYRHILTGKLLRWLGIFDKKPLDYPFARSDATLLYQHTACADIVAIDEQTTADMLVDEYADTLAAGTSIFGRQILYKRLREGYQGAHQKQRLTALSEHPALAQVITHCQPLREVESELSEQLFASHIPVPPKWFKMIWLAPIFMILMISLAVLLPSNAYVWTAVILAWGGLLFLQMHFQAEVAGWDKKMRAIRYMLHSFHLLDEQQLWDATTGDTASAINRQQVKKIIRGSNRSIFISIPGFREYADWVMLDNIKYYFKTSLLVRDSQECLKQLYLLLANLDADLALVRHLQTVLQYCWTEQTAATQLNFQQLTHPLLEQMQPLSIELIDKGAFISGQNGVGKSTLLRTVGLNLIVAKAFGFCYAATAAVPVLTVYSSMQSEDSLLGGESLYLTELRRARELLSVAEKGQAALFIIDEVFRGTNHMESISAAAAVLHSLSRSNLVIVSSHNLVLASLLEQQLTPMCVVAGHPGRDFLQLQDGVLAHTNGIKLLASQGLGGEIENKARRVFEWLSSYLAHPDKSGQILELES